MCVVAPAITVLLYEELSLDASERIKYDSGHLPVLLFISISSSVGVYLLGWKNVFPNNKSLYPLDNNISER